MVSERGCKLLAGSLLMQLICFHCDKVGNGIMVIGNGNMVMVIWYRETLQRHSLDTSSEIYLRDICRDIVDN